MRATQDGLDMAREEAQCLGIGKFRKHHEQLHQICKADQNVQNVDKCDQIVRSCTSCATAGPCTFPFERAAAKQPGWMLHSSPAAPNERTLRHANEAEAMQQFALKKHWMDLRISLNNGSQLSMATF